MLWSVSYFERVTLNAAFPSNDEMVNILGRFVGGLMISSMT